MLGIKTVPYMTAIIPSNLNRPRRSSIRRSKPVDLEAIHAWLIEEENQEIHGNFLCNWSVIEGAHRKGDLLVYIDGKTGLPLAFQLGRLIRPGILQVRSAYRGIGIGRKMVERCITWATKHNQNLLFIQCKPSTSISFWQHMGFTLIENADRENYAYQIIDEPLELPEHGTAVTVVIRFFPESKKWNPETVPYTGYSPTAKLTPGNIIYLAKRVQFHDEAFPNVRDVVVEIEVNGNSQFCDKAKYNDAHKIGIRRCTNGFYIDMVHLECNAQQGIPADT